MIKTKKTKTLTFRLTEEEYAFLEETAYMMGSNPSRFVRQLIQMAINTSKIAARKAAEGVSEVKEQTVALLNEEQKAV